MADHRDVRWMRRWATTWLAPAILAAQPLAAQVDPTALPPLLDEEAEIALARSAAPPSVSAEASVYVLRRGGHVLARAGTNGSACLVSRDHPRSLYPICYDPEATRTILPMALKRQELRERGVADEEIARVINDEIRTARIPLPSRPAIAFMMSPEQVIYAGARGRLVGQWYSHIMIYIPYLTQEQLGFPPLPSGHLAVGDAGQPTAHLVVHLPAWAEKAKP